jgi:hemerythrin-like domain-containing protein
MINLPGKASAPTFDSPLDMLHACHERIMDQCATLQKLMSHLPMHGCDTQAQQAAQAIMRYFDTAGKFHHQDEEEDLFPLLLATQNVYAEGLIKRLLEDHQAMEAAWLNLRNQLQGIADGKSATLERNVVADFSLVYGRHIMLENTKLLPLSAQILSAQQLHDIGKKMAARRGVSLP